MQEHDESRATTEKQEPAQQARRKPEGELSEQALTEVTGGGLRILLGGLGVGATAMHKLLIPSKPRSG